MTSAVDFWGCVSLNLFRENDFCHVVADKYEEAGYFTVGAHGPIIKDAEGRRFTAASLAEKFGLLAGMAPTPSNCCRVIQEVIQQSFAKI